MVTVTAFKWVPPFAQGQVRDLRVRWALEETGIAYDVRLIDAPTQRSAAYRETQPFGQVPVLAMDGETLFETGAIVLAIAERAGMLLGRHPAERRRTIAWLFAALNSVEPYAMNLAEVDFFMRDEAAKAARRPRVVKALQGRLGQVETALGEAEFFAGGFSIADLVMSTVLRIPGHTDILDGYPRLSAFKARCESRPAFGRALAGQLGDFAGHGESDMRYGG